MLWRIFKPLFAAFVRQMFSVLACNVYGLTIIWPLHEAECVWMLSRELQALRNTPWVFQTCGVSHETLMGTFLFLPAYVMPTLVGWSLLIPIVIINHLILLWFFSIRITNHVIWAYLQMAPNIRLCKRMKCNLPDLKKIKHPNIINLFCVALLPCGIETQIDMFSSD